MILVTIRREMIHNERARVRGGDEVDCKSDQGKTGHESTESSEIGVATVVVEGKHNIEPGLSSIAAIQLADGGDAEKVVGKNNIAFVVFDIFLWNVIAYCASFD